MSAPAPSASRDHFWVNPCGLEQANDEDSLPPMPVDELFEEIINNSNICHLQSMRIKENLLEKFEGLSEESLQLQKYAWLEIQPDLENAEMDEALRTVYYLLQKYAVVLDQMIEDQEEEDDNYRDLLDEMKMNAIQLLCSIQLFMLALKIKPHPDAAPDIMSQELRTLGKSGKQLRDILVIRDYTKATLTVRELFEFYKNKE